MFEPSKRADAAARQVVDAAFAVHVALGPGFLERIYEEALCVELEKRGVPLRRQVETTVRYRDVVVGSHVIDLIVDESVVVELKAVSELAAIHQAQAIAYLRATGLHLALVINFHVARLKSGIRRYVWTRGTCEASRDADGPQDAG